MYIILRLYLLAMKKKIWTKDKIHVSNMEDILKISEMAAIIDNETLLNINSIIEE